MAHIDVSLLLPQIVLTAGGVLLLLLSLRRGADAAAPWVSLAVVAIAAWACVGLWGDARTPAGGMMTVDRFAMLFDLLLLAAAGMTCLISAAYLGPRYELRSEYYALLLFSAVGMTVLAGATSFVSLFLGLEVFSIALYLMVAFTRDRAVSLEASLKYFLLGAFSSAFILYGMALVYGCAGSLDLNRIGELLLQRQAAPSLMLFAGIGLIVVGLGFKIGVVPFHFWIPDVYEGAPASVTAYMAAATKVAAFAALTRVLHVGFGGEALAERWSPLLGILAALTMTVANVVALTQTNLKRLLAYSSIAHAGYVLLAAATHTVQGLQSLVFYLLTYVFANLGAFAVAVAGGRSGPDREEGYRLADLAGLGRRRPALAAAMTVFLLSLTGVPPTAGFLGKWFVFRSALDADMLGLAVVMAINSAVAAYYYLGVIVKMYMEEPEESVPEPRGSAPIAASAAVAVIVTFWLGLFPDRALALVHEVALRFWGTLYLI
jgi:NADH-quinone oxidoreductase subunit N